MEHLIIPAIAMAIGFIILLVRDRLRESGGRRRAEAAAAGRAVTLVGRVEHNFGPGKTVTVGREGDRIVARRRGGAWSLPLTADRTARRFAEDDDDSMDVAWVMEEFRDPDGVRVSIGVRETDRRALVAMRAQPALPYRRRRRPARWALWSAGVLLAVAAVVWAAVLTSYPATGTLVTAPVDNSCDVRWTNPAGVTHTTSVYCEDDAKPGGTVRLLAQTGPLTGNASADDDFVEILLWAPLIGAAAALAAGMAAAYAGSRRVPVPLTAVRTDEQARGPRPVTELEAEDASLADLSAGSVGSSATTNHPVDTEPRSGLAELSLDSLAALADSAARHMGWDLIGQTPPAGRGPKERLSEVVAALFAAGWWGTLVIAAGAAAIFWDDLPARVQPLVPWVFAAVVLVQLVRAAMVWRELASAWSQPFTSEWDLVGAPLGGENFVLLCQGGRPFWLLPLRHRPPRVARALVRGNLTDGGAIQLKIGEHLYLPIGPVERIDDEVAADLRRALRHEIVEVAG